MIDFFEKDYARELEIEAAYDAAEAKDDEAGMEAARADHKAWEDRLHAKDKAYQMIYRLYSEARRRGNEYIDVSECWQYDDEAGLIEAFRRYNIERFTFTSTWSGAVESVWAFTRNGCAIEGAVEINGAGHGYRDDAFEKIHGLLFKVN